MARHPKFVRPGWFDPPVSIMTAPGRTDVVRHVEKAAEVLKDDWPAGKRGAAWLKACQACLDAHDGKIEPNGVAQPLRAAARAAGILVKNTGP